MNNNLDLLFIKYMLKSNVSILETKVKFNYLNDILAKLIFAIASRNMVEKNSFIPLTDLAVIFKDEEKIARFKAFNYPLELSSIEELIQFFDKLDTGNNTLKSLERTIIERYTRESLNRISLRMHEDVKDSTMSSSEILRRYMNDLDELSSSSSNTRNILSSSDILENEKKYATEEHKVVNSPTGITAIDVINGGLSAPSLTCICACPKHGKSTMLYNSLIESLKNGRSCVFVTIEIPAKECQQKILSAYTGISYKTISQALWRENTGNEDDYSFDEYMEKVVEFTELTKDKLFIIDDSYGISSRDISTYVRKLQSIEIEIGDIYIDYILIMNSNNPNITDTQKHLNMSGELRRLSQETDTRVFTAAQFHPSAERLNIEDLSLDDVYYTKNISQEATYVIALHKNPKTEILQSRMMIGRQKIEYKIFSYINQNKDNFRLGDGVVENEIDDDFVNSYKAMTGMTMEI